MRNYYYLFLTFLITFTGTAQNFNMSNGSITTCSGNFYDSGGNTGNYANNANLTYTIYPNTPGANVRVTFSMLNIESCCDYLYVYNGTSATAPLIGSFNGTTLPPVLTANNANGALTFRFTSDGSVTPAGWAAVISCSVPCQTITPTIVSTTPSAGPDNIIRLCQGQSVTFNGTSTFSASATGAVYTWNFGDGTTATGQTVSKSFTDGGGYSTSLSVTVSGCTGISPEQIIQVSTTPNITTSASPQTLCDHRTSQLVGNATPTPFELNCTPPISGVTFLPDGSGVDYETSITADCYPFSSRINAGTDISSVCMTIEHSYLGDLSIRLRCPNGQRITLKSQGNASTFLGDPYDDVTSGPGIGWEYCFTPTATILLTNAPTMTAPIEGSASIVPGNYLPTDNFNGLIGCPLNGNWTLEITDHLASDDGYIFEWGIELAENLSNIEGFTPTIVSQGWLTAPSLTTINQNNATAFPTTTGAYCYIYQVIDNFGCTYQEDICLDVNCTTLNQNTIITSVTKNKTGEVLVNWTAPEEMNALTHVLERMNEDQTWNKVDELFTHVDGTTEFSSYDNQPNQGDNYYRVRSILPFEQETRSNVKHINIIQQGLILFPNPASTVLNVKAIPTNIEYIQIIDATGKILLENGVSFSNQEINIQDLAPGIYQLKAGELSYKFIKQ